MSRSCNTYFLAGVLFSATLQRTITALSLILVSLVSTEVFAEPWAGQVRDAATGDAVAGAIVEVKVGAQSKRSITDEKGRFRIVVDPETVGSESSDTATVSIQAGGYKEFQRDFRSGDDIAIVLGAPDRDGEVVVITAKKKPLPAASSYSLGADKIRALPGSGNDVLKSVQSLPGVARVPFGGGGLVLRGTNPRDSSVFLDGIEVPILYHFGNLASFYPSGMLESMQVVPSGFGAQYGRAQGGLVTLESKRGRTDKWRAAGEVSLLDASVRADGPGGKNSSWSIGIRRSYVDAVLAVALPEDSGLELTVAPRYFDAQLRYDYAAGRDLYSVMLFGSDDALQFRNPSEPSFDESPDGFRFDASFWRLGAKWTRFAGDTTISVTPWVGIDRNELRVGQQGARRDDTPAGLRASVRQDLDNRSHETGIDLQARRSFLNLRNEPPPMPGVGESEEIQKITNDRFADLALYHTHEFSFGKGGWLDVKPGLRLERFGLSEEVVLDPRLTLRQRVSESLSFKQSVGRYHQPPAVSDKDWGNPEMRSSYSTQADAGVNWEPTEELSVGVTGFASQLERLPVDVVSGASAISAGGSIESGGAGAIQAQLIEEQFGTWRYREAIGKGRTYGAELLAKFDLENFFGWIAYTRSRATRTRDPRMDTRYYRYVLDQPNVVTALASYQLGSSWKFGARLRYATGNPFTPVASTYYDSDSQSYKPVDGEILSARLPDFFQLDLRVDRSWRTSLGRFALFIDLQNATNRQNAEGVSYNYDYSQVSYTRGLPIFPSLGLELVQ